MNESPQTESPIAQKAPPEVHSVRRNDLPLHCPTKDMPLWSTHPRVYLPIEKTGKALCPYCGTAFQLEE